MAAEAEAASIMKVQQAMADAMKLLNEAAPNDQSSSSRRWRLSRRPLTVRQPKSSFPLKFRAGRSGCRREGAGGGAGNKAGGIRRLLQGEKLRLLAEPEKGCTPVHGVRKCRVLDLLKTDRKDADFLEISIFFYLSCFTE